MTNPPHNHRGKLVTVPEEEHRMQHKTHGCGQSRVRKSKRKREVVKVEDGKEHVKDSREKMNSLFCSETNRTKLTCEDSVNIENFGKRQANVRT